MKKTLIIALALVASASFSTISAEKKNKKDKKQPQTECCQKMEQLAPISLNNGCDSLSYLAGQTLTDGLLPYLVNQMKVDTAYMADFVQGFRKALSMTKNPKDMARLAGMQIADQLTSRMVPGMKKEFTDTPDTIIDETLYRGFIDALTGDTTHFNADKAKELFREKQQVNKDAKVAKLTEAGRKFLAENKKRDGIITTPSGLQYEVLTQGEGEVPQKTDKVKVHYEGRLIDGTVFDASSKHGTEPSTFRPDQVIKGWTEALTMMPVGSKWRLYIPQELAYGERQAGQIPPYSTLIFDVELVGIDK